VLLAAVLIEHMDRPGLEWLPRDCAPSRLRQ
jgi:hypothetical protein